MAEVAPPPALAQACALAIRDAFADYHQRFAEVTRRARGHFERREHFETSRDVWELMRTVVRERKAREFDPTVGVLRELQADPAFVAEDAGVRERITQTLELMQAMSGWGEQMLRLEPKTLMKVMKLGARIQKLLADESK